MDWQAATTSEYAEIVEGDLAKCDAEQLAMFRKYSVRPYGNHEGVVVVAKRDNEVASREGIEEGFNIPSEARTRTFPSTGAIKTN
jgi:hypothetical protein